MSFFRRSNEPTARESFLVSAVVAAGFSEAQVNEAMEAKSVDFLKALGNDDKIQAVSAERDTAIANEKAALAKENAAKEAKDSAESERNALTAIVTGAGFTLDEIKSADAFAAGVKRKTMEAAVEISAARGIKPVAQAPSGQQQSPAVENLKGLERVSMIFNEKMKQSRNN